MQPMMRITVLYTFPTAGTTHSNAFRVREVNEQSRLSINFREW